MREQVGCGWAPSGPREGAVWCTVEDGRRCCLSGMPPCTQRGRWTRAATCLGWTVS